LNSFIPRYLNILLNDSLADRIQEIRIEGHTDDVLMKKYGNDPYLSNVLLSQMRSYNVLKYIREMPAYQEFTEEQQKRLEFWFTANGLSYGKALDDEDEYVAVSQKAINRDKSRRVEFRLVTSGEEVLENFVDKIK
jgi:flagellar motor protein MotB